MTDYLFSDDTTFASVEGISSAELDGEAVLLDVNSGQYFGLNGVGARIMTLIQKPMSIRSICDALINEFDVEREQLVQDVHAFMSEMTEHRLVAIVDGIYD